MNEYKFSRNAKIIDGCYSPLLFMHVLAATFQICAITFQVFTVSKITYTYIHFFLRFFENKIKELNVD